MKAAFPFLSFLVLVMPGCLTSEGRLQIEHIVYGTGGGYSIGFAYGEPPFRTFQGFEGPAVFQANDERNEGYFWAYFHGAERDAWVQLKNFTGAKDYQSDGVASYAHLHGATGNGTSAFPGVKPVVAAWGTATLQPTLVILGELGEEPSEWDAEVLLLSHGVRADDGSLVGQGTRAYTPEAPSDAEGRSMDDELHLILHSRADAGRSYEFRMERFNGGLVGGFQTTDRPLGTLLPNAPTSIEVRISATTPAATDMEVQIVDRDGRTVASQLIGMRAGFSDRATLTFTPTSSTGYRLVITGQSTGGSYSVDGWARPTELTIHFWWESLRLGNDAKQSIEKLYGPYRPPNATSAK